MNKRWLILGIVILLLVGFAFFSRENVVRLFQRGDPFWAEMQARGTWRVGMDPSFPPFEMLDAEGKPIGFDVDLAQRIAQEWGLELEVVAIAFDSLLDAMMAGKIDSVVSALPYDERMTQDVIYSRPYFEAGTRLVVRNNAPLLAAIDPAEQVIIDTMALASYQIAVEWGSMGDMVGRRLQRQEPTIELLPFQTPDEAITALTQNLDIDALLIDNVTLRQAQGSGAALIGIGPALEGNPYVIASPLIATILREQIEQTLVKLETEGVLTELEEQWFKK